MSSSTGNTIDLTVNKRGAEEAEVQESKKTKIEVEVKSDSESDDEGQEPGGMLFVRVTNENEITSYIGRGIFEDVVGYQPNTSFITEEMFKQMNEEISLEGEDSGYENMPDNESDMKGFLEMYLPFLEEVETGHVSAATFVMYMYY